MIFREQTPKQTKKSLNLWQILWLPLWPIDCFKPSCLQFGIPNRDSEALWTGRACTHGGAACRREFDLPSR